MKGSIKKALIASGIVAGIVVVTVASLVDSGGGGVAVDTEPARARAITSRVKGTGEITPERKVDISAKVTGEIVELPVREGEAVQEGDLLVQLERDIYEATRDEAMAALRQAEVAIESLTVRREVADRSLVRVQALYDKGFASLEELEAAQTEQDLLAVELQAQQHAVAQARSAAERAVDNLAQTTIRAPMSGTVIRLDQEAGETVVAGTTNLPGSVIMTVADMSQLLATVHVPEVAVVDLALDQEADIVVDALGEDEVQHGRVVYIAMSGQEDPALGVIRFKVKVALTDPHPSIRPAMTARVNILTARGEDVLSVPIQAVVKRPLDDDGAEITGDEAEDVREREVVYVVEEDRVRARPVTSGIFDELHVEVEGGLVLGDEVVVGPYKVLKDLHDGDVVEPRPAEVEPEAGDPDADDEDGQAPG